MKRIIIIGGMGPQASLELHRRIINRAIELGAHDGSSFPYIVHLSLPIDDFISDTSTTTAALNLICANLRLLQITATDQVVIACNTAHILKEEIEQRTGVSIISMINATIHHIAANHPDGVHLIATPTTLKQMLYEQPLRMQKIMITKPAKRERRVIEHAIRNVIAGKAASVHREDFDTTKPLLLGCTELSCVLGDSADVIDPMAIIVDKLLPTNN